MTAPSRRQSAAASRRRLQAPQPWPAEGFLKDGCVPRDLIRYRSSKPAGVKSSGKIQEILEACDLTGEWRAAAEPAAATPRRPDIRS
ncbi:hypothetical protein GCM10015535_67910 [Streptomyces gelaticus]|uniref:Uncharacterized protein n=1 Tax=Streptomyces gelaticus TaxID=285446 RepID=A0ABQ2W8U5_9ACTN|nr:hypothetical protein GCM10015535_67910 [Streptomyces gelaticus]